MKNNMETYKEQVLQYTHTIFGEFTDVILPSALKSSLVALILAVVVLVFLKKKRLFQRDNKIWNLIAKLHYPIWTVVFVITGFAFGAVSAVGSRAESVLEKTGKPFIEASIPIMYDQLRNKLPVSSPNGKITIRSATARIMNNLACEPKSDSPIEILKSRLANWVLMGVGEYAVNALVTKTIQDAGGVLNFSEKDFEFNQKSLMDLDFSQVNSSVSQIVYSAIEKRLKSFISGVKQNVFFMFCLAILLLLLDPLAHHYWRNKYSKRAMQRVFADKKLAASDRRDNSY